MLQLRHEQDQDRTRSEDLAVGGQAPQAEGVSSAARRSYLHGVQMRAQHAPLPPVALPTTSGGGQAPLQLRWDPFSWLSSLFGGGASSSGGEHSTQPAPTTQPSTQPAAQPTAQPGTQPAAHGTQPESKPDLPATQEALGQHIADKMDAANTDPHTLTQGIHYSYNFEYLCQRKGRMDLWKDEYRLGYANPQYFDRIGFMDWVIKPGVSASAAIKSWLRGLTVAECNSSVVAMHIDALRAGIGDKKFDEHFGSTDKEIPEEQRLRIKPGTQGTPVENYIKLTDLNMKQRRGGKITEKDMDTMLKVGEWYYFYNHPKYLLKHPGGAWQGENSLYMGKQGGQRIWSGLGASGVTEEGMYEEMVSAYNAPRDKHDERVMKESGYKNADGSYKDHRYDPKGGEFPDTVTKADILSAPAYNLGGTSRKGGFLANAGITIDAEKVKQTREEE